MTADSTLTLAAPHSRRARLRRRHPDADLRDQLAQHVEWKAQS